MPESAPSLAQVLRLIALKKQDNKAAQSIASSFGLSPLAARILAARGHTEADMLASYLEPTLKTGLPNFSLIKNIEKAAELIIAAVNSKKSIAVCCDFDVDGLSGGAQVVSFFQELGIKAKAFIPDRFSEGYGLNCDMVERIAKEGYKVLIAVDFGTTNHTELEFAKKAGLQTIVIDHHHVAPGETSKADVFINPQQPGCGFADGIMSAAGLAWYFTVAMRDALSPILPAAKAFDPRRLLDLACLGTICDMVPLLGVNRVIAKRGLELLSTTTRLGLVALKQAASINKQVSCYDVSFGIGPRINAAGRMLHGDVVMELLTTRDSLDAKSIAHKLNTLNLKRQETELSVKDECFEILRKKYGGELPAGIVIAEPHFHTGVIGIVAQRLVEAFYRPSIVLGRDENGLFKGSVRGVKGLSVVETLAKVSKHLLKFGGHAGAGGLSIEEKNLGKLSDDFAKVCAAQFKGKNPQPTADVDTVAGLSEITPKLTEELSRFAPFGVGNPSPCVLVRDLKVRDVKVIKGTHTKASLSDGTFHINGMLWRQADHPFLRPNARVDVAFKPDVSTFMGTTEVIANIQAVTQAA